MVKNRIFILFILLSAAVSGAWAGNILEDQVKAAFLYNFTNFVEWPSHAWPSNDGSIIITVVGNHGLADLLEKTVAGRKSQGRSLLIQRFSSWPEQAALVRASHLIYIDSTISLKPEKLRQDLAGNAILLVGNGPEFARRGGMIQFIRQGDRLVFEINRNATERVGLKISSRLFQVARIVDELPGEGR